MVDRPTPFWRTAHYIILLAAVGSLAGATWALFVMFQSLGEATPDPTKRRYLYGMAVIAAIILLFALFCVGLLIIRYFSYRLRACQGRHGRTEYVDAWRAAGERLSIPQADEDDWRDDEDEGEGGEDEEHGRDDREPQH